MASSTQSAQEPRSERVLVGLILLLAAALRLWSLDFGLPHTLARPDETEIVTRALLFFTGDLNPRFFHYPTLFFYAVGVVYGVWAGALAVAGQPLAETIAGAAVDLSPFLLLARGVSAAAGVATVGAVFILGRAMGGVRTGLVAALFLAVAPLHVRDAHFATTDVALTLFLTLTAIFALRALRSREVRDYAFAGMCSGLALSVKYVGLVMAGVITVTWLLSREPREWTNPLRLLAEALRDRRTWAFTGAMLGAFVLTSPYAVLDWRLFFSHFSFQLGHLAGGHGYDLGIGGVYHPRYTLPYATGWPVYLASFAGVAFSLRHAWREGVVLLSFPLLFYASTFSSHTLFLRYMLPVVPFVCLFAAFGLTRSVEALVRPRPTAAVLSLAALLLVAEPAFRSVSMNRLLGRTDSRVLAGAWLEQAAGPGTHEVYQTGSQWSHRELPPPEVQYSHLELPRPAEGYAEAAARLGVPAPTPRLQRRRDYRRIQAEARRDDALARGVGFVPVDSTAVQGGARPEYVVVLESDLVPYSYVADWARDLVEAEYEEVHRTSGASPGSGGWYDQHDAFFVPFKRLGGVARPGPDVTIYRHRGSP